MFDTFSVFCQEQSNLSYFVTDKHVQLTSQILLVSFMWYVKNIPQKNRTINVSHYGEST